MGVRVSGFVSTLLAGGAFALVWVACATSCATAGPCEINSDCPTSQSCRAGKCVRLCVDAKRDCAAGEVCDVNGLCAAADSGVPVDGGGDATISDGAPPDVVTPPDASPDGSPPPDSGPLKRELDLCANDGQCGSGLLCRPLYKGGPTRCTRTCSSSAQCMTGTKCITIGAETFCAQIDVGRTCNINTPGTCNFACVSAQQAYCTLPCTSGSDCPNGYGCATVSSQKVCVKAEQYCGGGQTCTSLLCDTGMLVSSCTLSCSSAADCPQRALPLTPWTCSGTCKRPADVVGPLAQGEPAEYACNGNTKVNLCNDAQHIDFDAFTIPNMPAYSCPVGSSVAGLSGDSCVDSCRFQGGCAHGYVCTGVGNISNQRVGLCLPGLGAGEVGQSCTKDRDCAFGYCSSGKCSRDCSGDGLCPTGSTCTAVGGGFPNVEGVPFKRCQ